MQAPAAGVPAQAAVMAAVRQCVQAATALVAAVWLAAVRQRVQAAVVCRWDLWM